ncbi:MAG: tetratricopeptide repeat protein [Acidobacteriota bacterium]
MTLARSVRSAAILCLSLALPAAAKDVYKAFLDPGIPQHKATLDILSRLDQTPNDASLHNDLGCLIARDGFWRDALREFETAEKLDKKDGRAPYNAGLVQTTRGEWGSARSAFKKAVDRDPGNWPAWWMLGFAEEKLGYAGAATRAYARSLRVDTSLFDVKRNPYALQSRLKARVLLETFDARFARAALPSTEQLAQPDVLTSFQTGHVAVTAAPGPVGSEEARGRPAAPAGPGGGPATVAAPAGGGAVVTSVPPVSSSRPAAPAAPLVSAPAAPARSGGLEEAPPWFPQTSPAGPAPARTPRPPTNPDPGSAPPAPPPPPGPGVG